MYEQLDLGNCYYRPSFFNMKVDTLIDLTDLNSIPEGTMGLYFHEYIHFLQDISTVYGMMNMSTIYYYIQACAHHLAENSNDKEFAVPISLEKIQSNNLKDDFGLGNFNLRPVYIGSSIKNKTKQIQDLTYELIPYEYEKAKFIDKVQITFKDAITGTQRILEFGGTHVCEGMAYICEQKHYSAVLPKADDYPYSLVQILADLICPDIAQIPAALVALCEMALMTYHPGLNYVRLLKFLQDDYILESDTDINKLYADCSEFIKGSHVDFHLIAHQVHSQLNKNFNADYYQNIKKYIDTIFSQIISMRARQPALLLFSLFDDDPKRNPYFMRVHELLGSPLVLDGEGNGTFRPPFGYMPDKNHFQPALFMAIGQILKMFYLDKSAPCELKDYCLKSQETDPTLIIDENCDHAPWKKARDSRLCPVGQIWHHWALKDYSPKY